MREWSFYQEAQHNQVTYAAFVTMGGIWKYSLKPVMTGFENETVAVSPQTPLNIING